MKIAKLLSFIFIVLMLVSNISYGQAIPSGTARYEALGNSPFILDASIDINMNPAWSTEYRNYAFGDLGRNVVNDFELSDQFGAVNFGLSKEVNLGLVLNKTESMWSNFGNWASNDTVNAPLVPLKVLFGWKASPTFSLGVAPYFASWSRTSTQTVSGVEYKSDKSSMTFGGTVGVIGKFEKVNWIEGAVNFKMNTYKAEYSGGGTTVTNDNDGGMEINVLARGWFVVNKNHNIKLVPYLNFGMFSFDPKQSATTTALNSYSWMNFGGGIGINMPVLDDGMIAGGLSAGYTSYKDEWAGNRDITYTTFRLPQINMGIEWNFTDWLQGRMGYSRAVISDDWKNESKDPNNPGTIEVKNSFATTPVQTISTGLGFQFGRFSFDGTVGERFWKQGPWLVSGQNVDLFGVISASYNFNK